MNLTSNWSVTLHNIHLSTMARATKVHPNCQNNLLTTASTVYMLHVNQQLSNVLYKTPISLYKATKPDLYPHVIGLSFSSVDIFCLGMEQLNTFLQP